MRGRIPDSSEETETSVTQLQLLAQREIHSSLFSTTPPSSAEVTLSCAERDQTNVPSGCRHNLFYTLLLQLSARAADHSSSLLGAQSENERTALSFVACRKRTSEQEQGDRKPISPSSESDALSRQFESAGARDGSPWRSRLS